MLALCCTLGWLLLYTAAALAVAGILVLALLGLFLIKYMAQNKPQSFDVGKIEDDHVRKTGEQASRPTFGLSSALFVKVVNSTEITACDATGQLSNSIPAICFA